MAVCASFRDDGDCHWKTPEHGVSDSGRLWLDFGWFIDWFPLPPRREQSRFYGCNPSHRHQFVTGLQRPWTITSSSPCLDVEINQVAFVLPA
jgi:hypothetical protein